MQNDIQSDPIVIGHLLAALEALAENPPKGLRDGAIGTLLEEIRNNELLITYRKVDGYPLNKDITPYGNKRKHPASGRKAEYTLAAHSEDIVGHAFARAKALGIGGVAPEIKLEISEAVQGQTLDSIGEKEISDTALKLAKFYRLCHMPLVNEASSPSGIDARANMHARHLLEQSAASQRRAKR